jgi:hypothetical protein
MRTVNAGVPDLVPILSRGKHRNARKGACFMELASFLAGERWTDHPRCTHPLLGSVCRLVNDLTADEHRARLAEMIPCVIGMTSDDPRVDARIALRCARAALPIAAAEDQNVMAVAVLAAERALAELEDRPAGSLEDASRAALASAPLAAHWARSFGGGGNDVSVEQFRRFAAPNIVRFAVPAVAKACVPDPDDRLYDLLVACIDDCSVLCGRRPVTSSRESSTLVEQ